MSRLVGQNTTANVIVGGLPTGQLTVTVDKAEIAAENLFSLATRNNPKRAFLFLSHVLGKHLPVDPMVMDDVHVRIANHIPDLPQPIVFIGMAETATCLGQGVFESWLRAHPGQEAVYLHTTRYRVTGADAVVFEEAHSHAPLQWFYEPDDAVAKDCFLRARTLVLVDDEISTGNTFINLAQACRKKCPEISHVHLSTITDFMGAERRSQLGERFAAQLSVGALLYGSWSFESNGNTLMQPPVAQAPLTQTACIEDGGFGRLGRKSALTISPADIANLSQSIHAGQRVLILGTGEFMHPAYVLARGLRRATDAMVSMHATTRSPIQTWGPIQTAMRFPDNYGEGIPNFLYNCREDRYDHTFLCHETGVTAGLSATAQQLGARLLHFHSESRIEENLVC